MRVYLPYKIREAFREFWVCLFHRLGRGQGNRAAQHKFSRHFNGMWMGFFICYLKSYKLYTFVLKDILSLFLYFIWKKMKENYVYEGCMMMVFVVGLWFFFAHICANCIAIEEFESMLYKVTVNVLLTYVWVLIYHFIVKHQ